MRETENNGGEMRYPDLASRALGGSVMWANDESFAEKENLIAVHDPEFDPTLFGHKGKVYDGWETRRRRTPGHDSVIIRLGVPGYLTKIDVDTSWFKGNYPPECSVDVLECNDFLPADQLSGWQPLLSRQALEGDSHNEFVIDDSAGPAEQRRVTHVRLNIFPDGGVARLRVYGKPAPDPQFLRGTIDLAAAENGGLITDCSNLFFSAPDHIIGLGRAASMADGWENARRRVPGYEYVNVQLAGEGLVEWVEVDTSYFVFNCPASFELEGCSAAAGENGATMESARESTDSAARFAEAPGRDCAGSAAESVNGPVEKSTNTPAGAPSADDSANWLPLVSSRLVPDTRHRFRVDSRSPITKVRLKVHPDGGISRLRVFGQLTEFTNRA